MRWVLVSLLVCCLLPAPFAPPAVARSLTGHLGARQKPGPVTIRGIATHVHPHDFTLQTTRHGRLAVLMTSATAVTEKGKHGPIPVREGDHVGVRGFLESGRIRAILVRIYPVKPRAYTIQGIIQSMRGSDILVSAGGKTLRVRVTSGTSVRMGNDPASARQMAVGQRVQIRIQPDGNALLAVSIHVYRHRVPPRHVELRGTVTSLSGGVLSVRSGSSSYRVNVTAQTTVYLGNTRSSSRELRSGEIVTVHACCAGGALTATSVHVQRSQAPHKTLLVRGSVSAITGRAVQVNTSHGMITVTLESSTGYEVGATHVGRSGVHVGDQVSVRAYAAGRTLIAERVHVYANSRRTRTVTGVVVTVSRSRVIVADGGKRYQITIGSRVPVELDGRAAGPASIRVGDRVRVTGQVQGSSGIAASRISARRIPLKPTTVRGTVTSVTGSTIVILDDYGARHTVRLSSETRVQLHGKAAPPAALFSGVRASAEGYLSGGTLVASTLTLSVVDRSAKGRIVAVSSSTLTIRLDSGDTARVELPPSVVVTDGTTRGGRSLVKVGAFVRVQGFAEPSGAVRAASVGILHPQVDLVGAVIATSGGVTMRTTKGDAFRLRFSASSVISTGSANFQLEPNQIPVGARVHVQGQMRSDGTATVGSMAVHLASVTLRAQIDAIQGTALVVHVDQTTVRVRASATVPVLQGSHSLALTDLVAGDDVTLYGYNVGKGVVLARKILVHRRLMGLDGTVTALSPDGFVLSAADGDHHVLVSSSTLYSGSGVAAAVGDSVHVTGYHRGDGAILATRVRVQIKHP